jgi:hypothetical protein
MILVYYAIPNMLCSFNRHAVVWPIDFAAESIPCLATQEIVHPNAVAREKAAPPNHARLERREASAYAGAGKPWGHDAQPLFRTSLGAQGRPPEQIKRGEDSSTSFSGRSRPPLFGAIA